MTEPVFFCVSQQESLYRSLNSILPKVIAGPYRLHWAQSSEQSLQAAQQYSSAHHPIPLFIIDDELSDTNSSALLSQLYQQSANSLFCLVGQNISSQTLIQSINQVPLHQCLDQEITPQVLEDYLSKAWLEYRRQRINQQQQALCQSCTTPTTFSEQINWLTNESGNPLCQSEAFFEALFNNSVVGIGLLDTQGNYLLANDTLKKMLGYPQHDLANLKLNINQVTYQADLLESHQQLQALLDKQISSFHIEKRFVRRDGSLFWAEVWGSALYDALGNISTIISTVSDVSKRHYIEQALRTKEAHMRRYFEQPLIGMATFSLRQGCLLINDKLCDMLAYQRQELLHKDWRDLVHPDEIEEDAKLFDKLISGATDSYACDRRYIRADGKVLESSVAVHCVRDTDGIIAYFVALVQDIGARKEAIQAIEQARHEAEQASRAKSTFLATMSHELRTPLNGILGYAQLLQHETQNNLNQQRGLEVIQRSGEHLLNLINDILDLSKIEAGQIDITPTRFNFPHFLSNLEALFQVRAEQQGLAFICHHKTPLPEYIDADEKRLRQIMLNLLGNAMKFTERGGVILSIKSNRKQLEMSVEDTGIGIALSDQERIFTPFQQLGAERFRAQGTGLGLSISRELVRMMGGELSLSSELGKGSCFSIRLPLQCSKNQTQTPLTHDRSRKAVGYVTTGAQQQFRILLIDQDSSSRQLLSEFLLLLGFHVCSCDRETDGLHQASNWHPDIILLDIASPVPNRLALLRQFQAQKASNCHIIVTSASVFTHQRQRYQDAGADAFLSKPLDFSELLNILQQQLPLSWIYQHQAIDTNTETKAEHKLNAEQAKKLYDLSRRGDIQAIIRYSEQLKQHKYLRTVAERILHLASAFRLKQIREIAEQILRETEPN